MPNETTAPSAETALPELTEADKFVLQWLEENAPLMQDEIGIDLARIRENLKLTPLERLRRFDQKMASIRKLRARLAETQANAK